MVMDTIERANKHMRAIGQAFNYAATYGGRSGDGKRKRKPVQKPHPKLNRYKIPQAIANLKEDVENYRLDNMVVFYYKTMKGYWRVHLHGYSTTQPFYYDSETMLGFDLLMTSESTYAGKIARQLARDIGADYQGINKSYEGMR